MIKKMNVTFAAKCWHIPFCVHTTWIFKSVPQIRHCVKIELLYFSLRMNYLTWSLSEFNFKVKV